MSYVQRLSATIVTDASGDATGYIDVSSGLLSQIRYVKTDYANGVDFTITAESTGETLWAELDVNASATRAPRQATHSVAGVASLYAATFAVNDKIALVNDRIKIVVAQGGNTKTGVFSVVLV